MFDANYLFILDEESHVETLGGPVTASNVVGRDYTVGDHFNNEYTPTFIVKGQTGGFTVRKDDVVQIVDLTEIPSNAETGSVPVTTE